MIKCAFKLMAFFWIISPATFTAMRAVGIFNYSFDWAIFTGLGLVSFSVMFLTFKRW